MKHLLKVIVIAGIILAVFYGGYRSNPSEKILREVFFDVGNKFFMATVDVSSSLEQGEPIKAAMELKAAKENLKILQAVSGYFLDAASVRNLFRIESKVTGMIGALNNYERLEPDMEELNKYREWVQAIGASFDPKVYRDVNREEIKKHLETLPGVGGEPSRPARDS